MNSLVITVGLMFVGSALGAFLTQGTKIPLAVLMLVIGVLWCGTGVFWSRAQVIFGSAGASLTSAASDARFWLLLMIVVWLFLSTMLFYRRTADTVATTANLEAQIAILKNDVAFLRTDFERYKSHRSLSPQQIDAVADFLSTRDPQSVTIAYVRDDRETRQYAIDFRNALAKGRWTVALTEVDDASFDVVVENRNPPTGATETKAGILLRMAFKEAGIDRVGFSTAGDGKPESTRLVIGPKRD